MATQARMVAVIQDVVKLLNNADFDKAAELVDELKKLKKEHAKHDRRHRWRAEEEYTCTSCGVRVRARPPPPFSVTTL